MDVDLYCSEVIADPWPTLARIREEAPFVWNDNGGYWMTARDRVCRQIFSHPDLFSSRPVVSNFFGEDAFIAIDDAPRHNALRNIWAGAFKIENVRSIAGLIRSIANMMLDPLVERLEAGESVDLIPGLCRHLPAYIIADMLGIPSEMQEPVVRWSDLMAAATAGGYDIDYDTDPAWLAGEAAKRDLATFLIEQIRYRRGHPGDDLISQIVHSKVGATMSEEAIMINSRQLLFAGNETSANWLGHIVYTLAQRPALRDELNADRSLLRPATEELLRWEPVVHALPRTVQGGDFTIEDVTLPDGAPVVVLLGAANRDPSRYDRPDELDIRRDASHASLAFGFGLHNCIGMALARLEAVETTAVLLDRVPDYVLAGEVSYGGFTLRGPATIPVALA